LWSTNYWDLKRIPTALPPIGEQAPIANFIDAALAKMDSAIAAQERMNELLKDRRSAIITQAVTKGLDPKAKMKDSGVPWLGQVPAHWEVKALKYVARHNQKTLGEDTNPDTEICYVEVSDVSQVAGIKSSEFMRFEDAPSRARRLMSSGEVIISTVRTYLKAIAFVGTEHDGKVCSTGFCVIRPTKIRPKFAQFALASDFFMASVISRSTGVSYPAINASDLVRVRLAIPPISEQEEIIAHLSAEVVKVDSAILAQERMIELLKERRTAIITQSVTGQIDVR
jgi:type I restriction enzyme S subunit